MPRRSLGEKGAGRSLHSFLYDQFDSNPAGFPLGERYTTGAPLGRPTGNDDVGNYDVGNELDLIAQYNVNQNLSEEAGYFWFWYGDYVDTNAPRDDAEMFSLQTTFKY